MKILVAGGDGQLGHALARQGRGVITLGRRDLDILDDESIAHALATHRPDALVNAAAYTAVDRAETETALAFALNAEGPARLARACARGSLPFIHVSTDYVFDGTSLGPYDEHDPILPLGVYGASKAEGERAARAAWSGTIVVRTAWVFSAHGANFVKTILRLAAERPLLRIVDDQFGRPTWAEDLAEVLVSLAGRAVARQSLEPTYHFCNAGTTTWCGFARAIVAGARERGPVVCQQIDAISTADYPTPASGGQLIPCSIRRGSRRSASCRVTGRSVSTRRSTSF